MVIIPRLRPCVSQGRGATPGRWRRRHKSPAAEAEILSVAIAPAWRGRGFARPLLDLHLRRLAGLGAHAVFLEVDQQNAPACRLYLQRGFYEVGRRQGYYGGGATALVLRRDLG